MNLNQTSTPMRPSSPSFLQRSTSSVAMLNLPKIRKSISQIVLNFGFQTTLPCLFNFNVQIRMTIEISNIVKNGYHWSNSPYLCINDLWASFSLSAISSSNHLQISILLLSPCIFFKWFKKSIGIPVNQWVKNRIGKSRSFQLSMIQSILSSSDIAGVIF